MPFHLAKRLSLFLSSSSPHRHSALLTPLLRVSFSTEPGEQKEIPFLAKYLISTLGFSPDRALRVSTDKHVNTIKSDNQPASAVKFLKEIGLSDDQIRGVISFRPALLSWNVEKSLKPKVHELMDAGFSGELLVHLIRYNPSALVSKDTLSRLQFCRDFSGNNNEILLKILKKHSLLITCDINKFVVPKINLFKEYGISNRDIVGMLSSGYRCMNRSSDSYKQVLMFIEEAGIPRKSGIFLLVFKLFVLVKMQLKERWSSLKQLLAFRKYPPILATSEDKVKSNMDFLIRKAKLTQENIAARPILLGYSLQKRLVPRLHVLSLLATKGQKKNVNPSSAYNLSEKRFFEKYIEPYRKDTPELAEAYLAACSGNIPV
ncbi:hypothetical protein LUZ62_001266 [Rhynchospora pubera]|uniref:Uncharacterized protein n=1 Tax=Rhynchospora pubera TaxID=906938 RepID=A0AAV8BPE0_9POAL|nr:hypothetical protein LUZ62_001266 [Rhynchospora pubera]